MVENGEYLTVAEFAELRGISTSAVLEAIRDQAVEAFPVPGPRGQAWLIWVTDTAKHAPSPVPSDYRPNATASLRGRLGSTCHRCGSRRAPRTPCQECQRRTKFRSRGGV